MIVLSNSELLVGLALSGLDREYLAVGLSKRFKGVEALEVGGFGKVGSVGLDVEPLVVVVLVGPQVNSVPNVSRGEVDSGAAVSSANSQSVSVSLASDSLDLPLLSSRFIVMRPEINIGLSAVSTNAEVLSLTVSVRDDVEGVDFAGDRYHSPAVLSLELYLLVEEGLLLVTVSVGGKLSLAVGLAERDDLSDWG